MILIKASSRFVNKRCSFAIACSPRDKWMDPILPQMYNNFNGERTLTLLYDDIRE